MIVPYSANTSEGMSVAGGFLVGAGFGMAVSESCLVMACWFKNARPEVKPEVGERGIRFIRYFFFLLFFAALGFGPILGIANAVEVNKGSRRQ